MRTRTNSAARAAGHPDARPGNLHHAPGHATAARQAAPTTRNLRSIDGHGTVQYASLRSPPASGRPHEQGDGTRRGRCVETCPSRQPLSRNGSRGARPECRCHAPAKPGVAGHTLDHAACPYAAGTQHGSHRTRRIQAVPLSQVARAQACRAGLPGGWPHETAALSIPLRRAFSPARATNRVRLPRQRWPTRRAAAVVKLLRPQNRSSTPVAAAAE